MGGAFYYEVITAAHPFGFAFTIITKRSVGVQGFGAKLFFDNMLFDHNFATSGGALMIDGRYENPAGEGLEILTSNSFFFENWGAWCV